MSLASETRALAADTLAVMRHPDARGAVLLYTALSAGFFVYALITAGLAWTLTSCSSG